MFATTLGGTISLFGTSTNLVLDGMLIQSQQEGLGFFELAAVGLPTTLGGIALLVLAWPLLAKLRVDPNDASLASREYQFQMELSPNSPMAGQTIQQAGLRNIPALFLWAIEREGSTFGPVGPDEKLRPQDRLVFAGPPGSVSQLKVFPGLHPVLEETADLGNSGPAFSLFEAVVSGASGLVGHTLKDAGFRGRYGAVVLAVRRAGKAIAKPMGEVQLKTGDLLLVEANHDFEQRWRTSPDFALITRPDEQDATDPRLATRASSILILTIALAAFRVTPLVGAALIGCVLMVLTQVIQLRDAYRSAELSIIVTMGASIGLGNAIQDVGLANHAADLLAQLGGTGAYVGLTVLFLATAGLTSLITNVAAAALIFPVALSLAPTIGVPTHSVTMVVAVGASTAFLTPNAYQTNLMVYGPGGYLPRDFLRMGLPLSILTGVITILIAA